MTGTIIQLPLARPRKLDRIIVADAPPLAEKLDQERDRMPWWGAIIWVALIIGVGAIWAGFGAFVAVVANAFMAALA